MPVPSLLFVNLCLALFLDTSSLFFIYFGEIILPFFLCLLCFLISFIHYLNFFFKTRFLSYHPEYHYFLFRFCFTNFFTDFNVFLCIYLQLLFLMFPLILNTYLPGFCSSNYLLNFIYLLNSN